MFLLLLWLAQLGNDTVDFNSIKEKVLYFKILPVFTILILLIGFGMTSNSASAQSNSTSAKSISNYNVAGAPTIGDYLYFAAYDEGKEEGVYVPVKNLLFKAIIGHDKSGKANSMDISLKPNLHDTYRNIGFPSPSHDVAVVYPIFTQAAYANNGFYYYYSNKCDSKCLTVNIPQILLSKYTSSGFGATVLGLLNYSFITDIDIDKNPTILKSFKKVILLHNEYVTKNEFDAINAHPNVIYLYPNALYAQVNVNYDQNTITLVKGHGYPSQNITNGFNWKFDNSNFESDAQCDGWSLTKIPGGKMLSCYPDFRMLYDQSLLSAIKK